MNEDLKNRTSCGQFMPDEERDYWIFWSCFSEQELHHDDVQCCYLCIAEELSNQDPNFAPSTMRPETFVVMRRASEMGIDLESRLYEIDTGEYVQVLSNVELDEIVRWLNSGIYIYEAEEWTHRFDTFDEAMKWRSAGFNSKMDREWRNWGDDPHGIIQSAAESSFGVDAIFSEFVPEIGFRELGFSLSEAIDYRNFLFTSQESNFYKGTSPRYQIRNYLPTPLNLDELLILRDEIELNSDLSWYEFDEDFWPLLRAAVFQLKSENLEISGESICKKITKFRNEIN